MTVLYDRTITALIHRIIFLYKQDNYASANQALNFTTIILAIVKSSSFMAIGLYYSTL